MHVQPAIGIPSALAPGNLPVAETKAPENGWRCILVAEDDADDVFLLRRACQKAGLGHRVMDVVDGESVVEYLNGSPPFDDRARYPFPDLLLLDLKMPRMNGFEVLAWLTARPNLNVFPVVVLSSSPLEADREKVTRLGAREFQTKPGEVSELMALLRSLHERWLSAGPPTLRNRASVVQPQPGVAARV